MDEVVSGSAVADAAVALAMKLVVAAVYWTVCVSIAEYVAVAVDLIDVNVKRTANVNVVAVADVQYLSNLVDVRMVVPVSDVYFVAVNLNLCDVFSTKKVYIV